VLVASCKEGLGLIEFLEYAATAQQIGLSLACQVDPARRTVQQLYAQPRLQLRDVLADCRTGNAELRRSRCQATLLNG